MVNGVPRLMLTVLFKDDQSQPGVDDSAAPAVHNAVAYAKTELRSPLDTLPDEDEEVEQLAAPAPRAAAPAEATAGIVSARRDSEPPVLGRQVDARVSHAPARRAEVFARQAEEDDLEDLDDDLAVDAMDDDLDDLLGAAVHVCRPAPAAEADLRPAAPSDAELGDSPVDRLSFMLRTRTRQLSERAKPLTDRARDLSKQGARGILPALRTLFAQLVLFASALRKKAGPAAASLFGRTQATVARLRSGEGARVGTKGGRPVRRQQQSRLGVTGRPPAAQAEVETRLDPQRARRRTVFLSSVAFLLVGTTVWALTPGDEVSEVATASDDTASPSSSAMEAAAPPSTVVSPYVDASAQLAEPAPVMEAAPVPSGPTPGPLAEPTYPTLGEERPAVPGSVASDSPYAEGEAEGATAAPEVQEGRTFGAESVSNARSFEITMSQPVRTLRGRAEGNGFVVDIPNALAISGARTISRNHPMVARSHILNHGDHSTLTIEFAEGQSPAYRVSARGAAIHIEIAR